MKKKYLYVISIVVAIVVLVLIVSINILSKDKNQEKENIPISEFGVTDENFNTNIIKEVKNQGIILELNNIVYDEIFTYVTMTLSFEDKREIEEDTSSIIFAELSVDEKSFSFEHGTSFVINKDKNKAQITYAYGLGQNKSNTVSINVEKISYNNENMEGPWDFGIVENVNSIHSESILIDKEINVGEEKCKLKKITISDFGIYATIERSGETSVCLVGEDEYGSRYLFSPVNEENDEQIYQCVLCYEDKMYKINDIPEKVKKLKVSAYDYVQFVEKRINIFENDINQINQIMGEKEIFDISLK